MAKVIHLGNAGKGALECGVKHIGSTPASPRANWTWLLENVTCRNCLALYKRKAGIKPTGRTNAEEEGR